MPKTRGKKRKNANMWDFDEWSGQMCPICRDECSNSGDHCLISLQCGHLFGKSCIRQWFFSRFEYGFQCPQCHAEVNPLDMRRICVQTIITPDQDERDHLKSQLEASRKEQKQLEIEQKNLQAQLQYQQAVLEKLRSDKSDIFITHVSRKAAEDNSACGQFSQDPGHVQANACNNDAY